MNKLKQNKLWVGMLIAVFLLGGFAFVGVQAKAQIADYLPDRLLNLLDRHVELERADAIGETIIETQSFGAVSNPVLPSPSWTFGGVRHEAGFDGALTQATTTFCAFKSPKATSTLISAVMYVDHSSTTVDMRAYIAKSEAQSDTPQQEGTPNASTTIITSMTIGQGVNYMFQASTSRADVLPESLLFEAFRASTTGAIDESLNDWIVFGGLASTTLVGNGALDFSLPGHCQVEWLIL